MANTKVMIKKIQTALSKKNYIIRINTYQFYSSDQKRFITGYSLVHKEWTKNKAGKKVLKDKELLNTCSQIEIVKYLAEKYKNLCEENHGETDTEAESLC